MRRKFVTFMMSLFVLISGLFITSCAMYEDEQGNHKWRLTSSAHKTIGDAGKASTDILGILSMFIPALAPAAAAAATGTYTWKRMGKKVTKYQTPLEHLVSVLEELKKNDKLWARVKPYLKGTAKGVWGKPSGETEVTIRGIIDKNVGAL